MAIQSWTIPGDLTVFLWHSFYENLLNTCDSLNKFNIQKRSEKQNRNVDSSDLRWRIY